jgi:hypothetical protein
VICFQLSTRKKQLLKVFFDSSFFEELRSGHFSLEIVASANQNLVLINFLLLPRLLPRSSTIAHAEIYASANSEKTKKKFYGIPFGRRVGHVECHEPPCLG